MSTPTLEVDLQRLKHDIQSLSEVGRDHSHGIYRMAFSEGDMAGRAWLRQRIEEAGLQFHQDGAANLHARLQWQGNIASVMTGSHIDTVPGAGHLDGALGVLSGLEALRVLKENNVQLKRPLEVVAFSDEEGRFGGMFGSQALSGDISPEWILEATDLEGTTLIDAMSRQGLNAMDALESSRPANTLYAFVELHIEQGPVLDREDVNIGVVEGICGLRRWEVTLQGTANHAGTTPMEMRNDAFQGLAEFATQIDRILQEHGGALSVATIGRVELLPGAANVVPGEARFSLEFRDLESGVLDELSDAFRLTLSTIARRRQLMFEFKEQSNILPISCDTNIRDLISRTSTQMGYSQRELPSGAAHDSQKLAHLTRTGMIFVPSKAGRSHSAAEWTAWSDIKAGANVLLNTLYQLAMEDPA
jgi:beta-ureidopropionase / N-carbamoyl-L-amino-acid hydrolase